MALNIAELKGLAPEVEELASSTRGAADNHRSAAEIYRTLIATSTWEGHGADAAHSAMEATAGDHDSVAEQLGSAADRMEGLQLEAEALAEAIKRLLDDAAASPAVGIDEATNAVIPPDTSYMTEEYAAQVAAKVADLQARIAAVLADGESLDADLAAAINAAADPPQTPSTASTVGDLLLPQTGAGPRPARGEHGPDGLGDALGELAGTGQSIGPAASGTAAAPLMPLDPAKVDQFKDMGRRVLEQQGGAFRSDRAAPRRHGGRGAAAVTRLHAACSGQDAATGIR